MGHTIPQTLRVMGHIQQSPVVVLVDSGSTHNFIQDRVAKKLNLPTEPAAHEFKVLVGNGEELNCSLMCSQVKLQLGSHFFTIDFFILPLSGAEIVLGVQWLKTLGPVVTDYEKLTMRFQSGGKVIQLSGEPKTAPSESSLHQLQRMVHTNALNTAVELHLCQPSPPIPPDSPSYPTEIQPLLDQYSTIFTTPTTLPPVRFTDHRIPLLEGSNPVNIRPYRYPHFQKQEIETQIQEMLDNGTIQPSSSPFSSPVLLVRKKDGTWRFCVDYRGLNAITCKDRFPIPAIDELLDELYGTKWFSKLDLRSGYHQIRMHPSDIPQTAFRTHQGHYEFLVMPFGLCNAPSTFQSTMNMIFQPFLRRFVIVFFDDILVYSKNLEDHIQHLELVFKCLLENTFYLKLSKC
jgi:predicted aspartyl protease